MDVSNQENKLRLITINVLSSLQENPMQLSVTDKNRGKFSCSRIRSSTEIKVVYIRSCVFANESGKMHIENN